MKFTGERYVPGETGEIRLEHMHRYAVALAFASGGRVLDVACGEGYGTRLLATVADSAVGLDVSGEAVAHARQAYAGQANLAFEQGSAAAMPFGDAAFDLVVSFETIEHLAEQSGMVAEIRRVLKPDGLVVLSSPNRPVYSPGGRKHNEFHVKELDLGELDALLRARFPAVRYLGQRLVMGSVVQPLEGSAEPLRPWSDDGATLAASLPGVAEPMYFVALAASDERLLPAAPPTLLLPASVDLLEQYRGYARWAQQSNRELDEARAVHAALQEEHSKVATWATTLDRELIAARHVAGESQARVAALEGQLALARERADAQAGQVAQAQERADALAGQLGEALERSRALEARIDREAAKAAKAAERERALKDECAGLERRATDVRAILASVDAERIRLRDALARAEPERDALVAALSAERARGAAAATLAAQAAALQAGYDAMRQSLSWKLTAPLRWAVGASRTVATGALRAASDAAVAVSRAVVRAAVPSEVARRRIRLSAFSRTPLLFRGNPAFEAWRRRLPQVTPLAARLASGDPGQCGNLVDRDDSARRPRASVIVPVYGQLDYTLRCLASTLDVKSRAAFELVVVDDGSPDESFEVLAGLPGIRFVANDFNQGFIRTCNHGARVARGEFLLFLNNDTVVQEGWLDELIFTFDDVPECGLAGSMLLYPDGRLQEAGGIIWSDGSGWNYGRLDDPFKPEYGYRRDVDYCSGASLMVRADLFAKLGGFDEHYLPAYGEDSDLAFRVRQAGQRVLYQPRSRVIHYEGITSGTDLSQGAKAYQVANAKKLFERWKDVLADHGTPGENPHLARDRNISGRVLVIDHCTPTPDQDAGSITTLNLMRILQSFGFKVTFIPEDNLLYLQRYTTELERAGIECLVWPHVPSLKHHLAASGHTYDAVVLFRVENAMRHLDDIELHCPQAKVIFHTSDLHFLRTERQAELEDSDTLRRHAARLKEQELSAIGRSAATIVHSSSEKALLDELLGWKDASRIFVHGWAIPIPGTEVPFGERDGMVFVGGYQHTPNVDAVDWFVTEVFPLVRERLPKARFLIVGSKAPERFASLGVDGVEYVGYVAHLNDVFDRCRLSIAPLRFGAGIKGKIYTSLSHGLPCVSTTVGAEGMGLVHGASVLVADSPGALATEIVRLHEDEALWNRLQAGGFEHLHAHASLEAGRAAMASLLAQVGLAGLPRLTSKRAPGAPLPARVRVEGPQDFERHLASGLGTRQRIYDRQALVRLSHRRPFAHEGSCDVCGQPRAIFRVDEAALPDPPESADPPAVLDRQLACTICGLRSHERALAVALRRLGEFRAPDSPLSALVIAGSGALSVAIPHYVANVTPSFAAPEGPPAGWRLPMADESLDAVACVLPPHDEADLGEMLGEIHRVLREDGTLLLSAPPSSSPDWTLAERLRGGPWSQVAANLYWAEDTGHLGVGACHFSARRASPGAYATRVERELARYEDVEVVHDLPAIFHYWSHHHLRPIFEEAGIASMERFFASNLLAAASRTGSTAPRFLSIGSGNCDLEVNVALALRELGARDFTIECLELNPDMLERGRQHARSHAVQESLQFTRGDFNAWTPARLYDGIMANQSLHHVTRLEFLFEQVKAGLQDDGAFVVSDIIGRNGHMRWPEALAIVNELWKELPASHKYNHALQRTEDTYENWDCSKEGFEGIRAQDILPLLIASFHFRTFVAFGNVIDIFIDRAFGPNFSADDPADRAFIDRAHAMDEEGFQSGRLTPTHLMGVMGKHPVANPFHSRALRPERCVRLP